MSSLLFITNKCSTIKRARGAGRDPEVPEDRLREPGVVAPLVAPREGPKVLEALGDKPVRDKICSFTIV